MPLAGLLMAKGPVSANIDAPEENNESHSGIIEKGAGGYAIRYSNRVRLEFSMHLRGNKSP